VARSKGYSFPALYVIGLFKPTFIIRDAGTLPVNCRPPRPCLHDLDVGSSEARRRRPTCPMVQVINGLTRHGGDILRNIKG